jgi:hypothetical protein
MQQDASLGLGELLKAVSARGFPVTKDQLHRWRTAGLVRTPELTRPDAGPGRAARYPASTVELLLALQRLLKRSRNLDTALWQLFLSGHDVEIPKVRALLARVVTDAIRQREAVIAGTQTDDDAEAARFAASLPRTPRSRLPSMFERMLRKRERRAKQFAGTTRLLEIAAGLVTGPSDPADAELLHAVVGNDGGPVHPDTPRYLSRAFDPERLEAALATASDADLGTAARELHGDVLPLLHAGLAAIPGIGTALALYVEHDPDWPDPTLFLLWLRFRAHPLTPVIVADIRARLTPYDPPHA